MTQFFNRLWYQGAAIWARVLLTPFSWLYAAVCCLRRVYYHYFYQPPHFAVPIIVVGNLSVGGTGKTPLTLGLIHLLQQNQVRVGVIARGYRSQAEYAPQPILIHSDHSAKAVGDEALLLYQSTGVPIAVHHQRVKAAQCLLQAHPDLQVILSDDGLQHLKLPRNLEIIVIDGERQLGNGALLPAGPLREPASRLAGADFVLYSGVEFRLEPLNVLPLDPEKSAQSLDFLKGKTVHAVAGIGHPERFFASLEALGAKVMPHVFPDHHAFCAADFKGFAKELIVMTAKDAVKCTDEGLSEAYYLNTQVKLSPQFADAFLQKVRYIMRLEQKRSS